MKWFSLAVLLFVLAVPVLPADDLNSGSACSHISGGCPTFHHDSGGSSSGGGLFNGGSSCDSDCQKAKEEAEFRRRSAQFDARMAKDHAKAEKLAAEAYDLIPPTNHADCKKAVELYDKAIDLWTGRQNYTPRVDWDQNMGVALVCFGKNFAENSAERYQYDKFAYDYFARALDNVPAPEDAKKIKWTLWTLQYNHGRRCPEPPGWSGDNRVCVGRTDMKHDAYPYVPMPIVTAQEWKPRNLFVTAHGWLNYLTDSYHSAANHFDLSFQNEHVLEDEMETDENTAARLTMPDGHDIVIGFGTDVKLEGYTYDPNQSLTTIAIGKLDGLMRIVSSRWQHFKEQKVNVKTPHGTLGMRGTDVAILHFNNSKGGYGEKFRGCWVFFARDGYVSFDSDDLNYHSGAFDASSKEEISGLIIRPDGKTDFVTMKREPWVTDGWFDDGINVEWVRNPDEPLQ